MANLYNVDSPIDRDQRKNLNDTFADILTRFSNLQRQLNILAGGQEVEKLLARIDEAINNAINTTADTQQVLDDISAALNQLEPVLNDALVATNAANGAADDANVLNVALTALKQQLEALQNELSPIVASENARVTAEQTRSDNEADRVSAEEQRVINENARVTAEQLRVANNEALEAILDNLQSVDYDPTATYDFPTLVSDEGSTFIALQEVTGVKPIDDKVNYRLVSRKGLDGQGAVQTVNNRMPDETGNVKLGKSDIEGLETDLTNISDSVEQLGTDFTKHLDESNYIFNSNSEPTNADAAIMKDGDIFIVYGDVFGTLLDKYFEGVNGTTPYLSWLNTFSNIVLSGAAIGVDTHSIQNNMLETHITPTTNGGFVLREFVSQDSIDMPPIGEKINFEIKVHYPSVRESIFGLIFMSRTGSDIVNDGGLTTMGDYIRLHYSQSVALNAASVSVGQKVNASITNPFTKPHTVNTSSIFKARLQLERTATNYYTARWYENDVLMAVQENVEYHFPTFYPLIYNQSTQTNAQPLKFEYVKVW